MTPQELRSTVGRNIRARRKELGITQVALAERLSISQAYLCQLETGSRSIDVDWLAPIAVALQTSPAALMAAEPAFVADSR